MQIISGQFRGRKLNLPPNGRPTQNRARVALFNMMTSIGILPHAVWDAFAGSGAFGIECLSRYLGARVVFSDTDPKTVKKNLATIDVDGRATVVAGDAMGMIEKIGGDVDLVFLDPPYAAADLGRAFVRKLGAVARAGTILIWEQDSADAVDPDANIWDVLRDKTYGRARFLILQRRA